MSSLSMAGLAILFGQLLGYVLLLVLAIVAIRFLLAVTRWINLKSESIKFDLASDRRSFGSET